MRSGDATGSGTALPADESAEPECTSPAVPGRQGLDSAEVELRRQLHGANTFAPLPTKSMLQFIGSAFEDPMLRILVAAAAISMLLGVHSGEYADGIAITVAVLIVVAVGAGNEWRAQRDYTALDQITSRELVKVTRDGTALSIDASEIVVGDLVELGLGDVVPADVHLTGTTGLIVDESQITGEPLSDKSLDDALFAGSRVLDGRGFGVVTAVGDATVFGSIRGEIGGTDRSTPLQERLERFAVWIGRVGSATAVLTFLALVSADLVRGTATAGFNLEFGELL
ncbi:MAG: hypothetical protein KDB31_10410, partial [Microthrixaceae bacterium]|nr:hypothetical protein [Microthrixaceae bacterium]